MSDLCQPGDKVPKSGIYAVLHDDDHDDTHEVTCIAGKRFPPCHGCGDEVRFTLVRAARHVSRHRHFR
jgi:hypothetical protein